MRTHKSSLSAARYRHRSCATGSNTNSTRSTAHAQSLWREQHSGAARRVCTSRCSSLRSHFVSHDREETPDSSASGAQRVQRQWPDPTKRARPVALSYGFFETMFSPAISPRKRPFICDRTDPSAPPLGRIVFDAVPAPRIPPFFSSSFAFLIQNGAAECLDLADPAGLTLFPH